VNEAETQKANQMEAGFDIAVYTLSSFGNSLKLNSNLHQVDMYQSRN